MTITVEQAQSRLKELIARSASGETVVITDGHQPVAQLLPVLAIKPSPVPGFAKGTLTVISDDEDHLGDFADYMPGPPR